MPPCTEHGKPDTAEVHVSAYKKLAPDLLQGLHPLIRAAGMHGHHCDPRWLSVLAEGLRHVPYLLVATRREEPVGLLPLAFVRSRLFGRFLVSLPYVNSAGVLAENGAVAAALLDRAVALADELDVHYLELRHERRFEHAALGESLETKAHMRLALPKTVDELWKRFTPKVRNQVRKGEKAEFAVSWGREEALDDYYTVFAHNMRDLGTPVFGRRLFAALLDHFPAESEICLLRAGSTPVAAALLVHGPGMTEVPSASSLRQYNPTNANMLMYWHLLIRAVERGQPLFDFGRSTLDSNTYRFKKQWGARPEPAVWQYYLRKGRIEDMRREAGHYDRLIALWRRMPLWLTRIVGPRIVRGIP